MEDGSWGGLDHDRLGALPKDELPELGQHGCAFGNGEEVIPLQRPELAGKTGDSVGEENLRLADPTRIKEELAGPGLGGGVFGGQVEPQIPEWDPSGLAAPPGLYQLAPEGKQRAKGGTGARGQDILEAGAQRPPAGPNGDPVHPHRLRVAG